MSSDTPPRPPAKPVARRTAKPVRVHRAASELTSLANVLPEVGRALGMERKAAELATMALWRELTPEPYCSRSRALKLMMRGHVCVLQVGVDDGATASDLSFQLEAIRTRMNVFSTQTGVTVDRIDLMTRR